MVPSFVPMAMFRPSVAVEHHYRVPPHQKLRAPLRFWAGVDFLPKGSRHSPEWLRHDGPEVIGKRFY